MLRKICVVTASRAEYGLLYGLIRGIDADPELCLQLIVTGTHLSYEFGLTVREIEEDGIKISKRIEMLLASDSAVAIAKSMGLLQIGIAEAYDELKPDIVVVLGDRFELIPIVSSANLAAIPVAHISGGEITEGAVDELFRHAVTKLSQIHFTAIERYRQRVVQMGEQPESVFNIGEAGLDNIRRLKLLSRKQVEKILGRKLDTHNLLFTYHPEIGHEQDANRIKEILAALGELKETLIIFTLANADRGGRIINQLIQEFVSQNTIKAIAFDSLGKLKYLSVMQYVDAVVGNSSSGIVEAPSLKVATINIGNRQKGRIRAESVIDVCADRKSISGAFKKLYSADFGNSLSDLVNPYGDGKSSLKIKNILKTISLESVNKKIFFDIKIDEDIGR